MIREKIYNFFIDWKELFRPGSFKEFENYSANSIGDVIGTKMSWEKTLLLFELCRLSYMHDVAIRKEILKSVGLNEECYFSNKGAEFFMFKNNDVKIICFVGTNNVFDYKNIFTYGSVNWNDKGKIYKGFKKSFDNIKDKIEELSSEIKNERVCLIGHSFGGVLAVLSSFYFKNAELNVYGLPKIGDKNFVENVKMQEIYHFDIENDIITKLPLANRNFIALNSKQIPSMKSENRTCPSWLYAHAPINYAENIKLSRNNDIYK